MTDPTIETPAPAAAVEGDSRGEVPVRFAAGRDELFGIITEPADPRGIGVVVAAGGALAPSTMRNRFSVRLARRLAEAGYHAMRFDYHGIGESDGSLSGFSLNHPFTADLLGAVRALRARGLTRIVLIGTCFGSRTVLSAIKHLDDVRAMALVSMPLGDFDEGQRGAARWAWREGMGGFIRRGLQREVLLGMFRPALRRRYLRVLRYGGKVLRRKLLPSNGHGQDRALGWLSRPVAECLALAVDRRVELLLVYGSEEYHYREFRQAEGLIVGKILARGGERVRLAVLGGAVAGLSTLWVQEDVIGRILSWLESIQGVLQPGAAAAVSR